MAVEQPDEADKRLGLGGVEPLRGTTPEGRASRLQPIRVLGRPTQPGSETRGATDRRAHGLHPTSKRVGSSRCTSQSVRPHGRSMRSGRAVASSGRALPATGALHWGDPRSLGNRAPGFSWLCRARRSCMVQAARPRRGASGTH